jgi:predicted nucleotidyltransferase
MIDEQILQEVVKRIVAAARPSRVILFGSYGRGDADEGSDLDLMVIVPGAPNQYEEMVRLDKVVGNVGVGVDVLIYSEAEYERRSQVPGTVLYWARKEGRALYVSTPSKPWRNRSRQFCSRAGSSSGALTK